MRPRTLLGDMLRTLQRSCRSAEAFEDFLRRCGLAPNAPGDIAAVAAGIAKLSEHSDELSERDLLQLLRSIKDLLATLVDGVSVLDGSSSDVLERALGGVFAEGLEAAHPGVLAFMLAFGVIDSDAGWRLNLEQFFDIVTGQSSLRELYAWDNPAREFHWERVLHVLLLSLSAVRIEGRLTKRPTWSVPSAARSASMTPVRALGVAVAHSADWSSRIDLGVVPIPEQPAQADRIAGLWVGLSLAGAAEFSVPIHAGWSLDLDVAVDSNQSLGMLLLPSGLRPAQLNGSAAFGVTLRGEPKQPWQLLGEILTLRGAELGVRVALAGEATPSLGFSFRTASKDGAKGVVLALNPGEGDSFLRTLLGDKPMEIGFDIGASWSFQDGLRITGGISGVLELPGERQVGPLRFSRTRLAVAALAAKKGDRGGLSISGSTCIGAELGPLDVRIDEMGLALQLATREHADGLLGRVDARLGFKPPKGIGFAIDSETVKGGGFLELDFDAGRYAGVLELVTPSFGLTALGILTTKIPGEPKGWSLFFALTATFNPGIQIGFGFVLTGVGGLFAVNRRLDEPAMRAAVRGGNLDSVLFPTDVVAEAPKIFATVESMFPIAKGSFVFGPMIKIGWGSPTLVEAMIGVFVSLPSPLIIALLGRLRLALPNPEKPVLLLNMDIAGSINFGAGTVGLDAQIHDSTLFGLELTGAMAFRARFKDQPGFLLSVGGFHPAFEPPADVGKLARMGLSIRLGKGENILVSLRSYFALTSNTLQFGAAIDVSAGVGKFKIAGGAYFDALIVYKPFHFTADMGAYFSVAWGKWDLLAVRVALTLDGPGPWRARGLASFTIARIELSFEFDETFGDKIAASTERAPVRAPLLEALAQTRNWGGEPGGFDSLRLRDLPPGGADDTSIIVAPGARLAFRQRVAPLGVELEQMGPLEPQESGPFEVKVLGLGGREPSQVDPVTELFAPAAYLDLDDEERLSAPSFQPMRAGVVIGSDWKAPPVDSRYTVVDGEFESLGGLWPEPIAADQDPLVELLAALGRRGPDAWKRMRDEVVKIESPKFVRAAVDTLAAADDAPQGWHEVRARRVAGQRILPAHAVRKAGR